MPKEAKTTDHYFDRYDRAEGLWGADPVAALRRLQARFYHAALAAPYAAQPYLAGLMQIEREYLPYLQSLADARGRQEWAEVEYRARHSFEAFVHLTKPDYESTRHQTFMARRIQTAVEAPSGRLYIGMPPRHGKSELCSTRLPAWALGRDPSLLVMLVCNTQELASMFSRRIRDFVFGDPLYQRLFPAVQPDAAKQSQAEWLTTAGGGLKATGVGGTISGRGADLLIIDDPHKDDDWHNDEVLRRVYDWYMSAARTRLSPGASVVLLMTRWHERDLAGRLLVTGEQEPDADQFETAVLPAIAGENDALGREPGEALWPERFDLAALAKQRAGSPETFEALYQQNPQAFSDYLFDAGDFVHVKYAAGDSFWTADLALTMNERSDYCVLARWVYAGGILTLTAARRYRGDIQVTLSQMAELVAIEPHSRLYMPRDAVELSAQPILAQRFSGWGFPLIQVGMVDKRVKAMKAAALATEGRLAFVSTAPGVEYFMRELAEFPNGEYDDCVDALSVAARVVLSWGGAEAVPVSK